MSSLDTSPGCGGGGAHHPGIEFRPSSPAHIGPIAHRMRDDDRIECAALGHSPKQALREGIMTSSFCLTAFVNGRAEAMFGLVVTNALCGEGRPWMLGSDMIYRRPRAMLCIAPRIITTMLDSTPRLSNLVACGNSRAIRFLTRMGFAFAEEIIVHAGTEFLTFELEQYRCATPSA
ncbi:hypothetical protein [Sphingomonas sp.]|uniref:hypothetical protein n=1 Tax=Sphingomonas sp. TaxID=28214 RepID=UPI003D6C886E